MYNPQFELEIIILSCWNNTTSYEDNIYIVRANGNIAQPKVVGLDLIRKALAEGDTIIVPVDYDYRQSLPFWKMLFLLFTGVSRDCRN